MCTQIKMRYSTCSCGLTWAAPEQWFKEREKDHKYFYCPNGCERWFPDVMEKSLERRLKEKDACCTRLESTVEHQEHVINGYKGHVTKLRKAKV